MSKLDSLMVLRLLQASRATREAGGEAASAGALPRGERVNVSVRFTGELDPIIRRGLALNWASENTAHGSLDLADVEDVAALDNVIMIQMTPSYRLQLKDSVPAIHADRLRTGPLALTGAGVVVGIIDSGIDVFHHSFRKPDGTSRILWIWDQSESRPPQTGEQLPAGFGVGVEFPQSAINAALADTTRTFRHRDTDGHGTHVAGIAAGDGSQAGNCHGPDTYIGVAPGADLIIVKVNPASPDISGGVRYIFDRARRPDGTNRPVVINISMGADLGPHDGSDILDADIDTLVAARGAGCAVVVAAGNSTSYTQYREDGTPERRGLHARRSIAANATTSLDFTVPPNDDKVDTFDIWYGGGARLEFTLRAPVPASTPGGNTTAPVAAGAPPPLVSPTLAGHTVDTFSDLNNPLNGRHRITFRISPPAGGHVAAGAWTMTLRETAGQPTVMDCWVYLELKDRFATFAPADSDYTRTIDSPGSARNVITVGSYDPQSSELAPNSGRGPTIGGFTFGGNPVPERRKPDICAPGVGIFAPRSNQRGVWYCCDCCLDFYVVESGTSMAAPHVTGVVALRLQQDPSLTFTQLGDRVRAGGQPPDPITGPTLPNNDWGHGKIDAHIAVTGVPAPGGGGGGGGFIFAEPAGSRGAGAWPAPTRLATRLRDLEGLLGQSPVGQLLAALVSNHFDEVYRLVNSNRRVATIWHRVGGPLLLRELLMLLETDDPVIPVAVAGQPLGPSLERLLAVIARYGSTSLRADIDRYRPLLLALPGARLSDLRNGNLAA